ncbi:MAG: hypothetical protein IT327_32020 [Anaerolineae bacterium]|nr:hypothetical protein [Anaerolineae bacterium]
MNERDLKKLRKAVNNKIKHRSNTLVDDPLRRKQYRRKYYNALLYSIFASVIFANTTLSEWRNGDILRTFTSLCPTITGLLSAKASLLKSKVGPKERFERDIWIWETSRNNLLLNLAVMTVIALFVSWPPSLGLGISYRNRGQFIWFGWFCATIAVSSFLLVAWKPKLFFSQPLNYLLIGSSNLLLVTFPIFMVVSLFEISNIFFLSDSAIQAMFLAVVLIAVVATARRISKERNLNSLNTLQASTLKVVRPERLLQTFQTYSEEIASQINALKIIQKLEKREDYSTQLALLEILAQRYKPKSNTLKAILVTICLFIFGAIGEAFFQDLLYDSFLMPLLCRLTNLFCG